MLPTFAKSQFCTKQKLSVLQPLKDMFQMRPRAKFLAKFPMTLLHSSLGSDGCCGGCLEARDGLGVLLIHPVLEVTLQIEI